MGIPRRRSPLICHCRDDDRPAKHFAVMNEGDRGDSGDQRKGGAALCGTEGRLRPGPFWSLWYQRMLTRTTQIPIPRLRKAIRYSGALVSLNWLTKLALAWNMGTDIRSYLFAVITFSHNCEYQITIQMVICSHAPCNRLTLAMDLLVQGNFVQMHVENVNFWKHFTKFGMQMRVWRDSPPNVWMWR